MSATREAPVTISVAMAARVLGISRNTAYRHVATGEIPSARIGKRIVIPTHRLADFLNGKTGTTAAE